MGGKAAMLLVLGFSLIFLVFGSNFNSLSTRSVDNNTAYYIHNMSHNTAIAGANLVANKIFMDREWDDGYLDLDYQGGIINVYVTNPSGSSTKTEVCHNKGTHSQQTISIAPSNLATHLAHGDVLGSCGTPVPPDMVIIYSEGIYQGDTSSVYVELRPSTFAKYGNFYDDMGGWPATGDIFDGPFHVNSELGISGSPEFLGKVTSTGGLVQHGVGDPIFHGEYDSGVDLERPFDTTGMRMAGSNGGLVIKDTSGSGNKIDVEIEFINDKVEYRYKINDGADTWSPIINKNLSDFNGMMYVEKGNVFVKGEVGGSATIVATKQGLDECGSIYQTDDLKYKDNVSEKPDSDNMLGLVAEQDIRLQYNDDTKGKDIISQASMYAFNGNVGPDIELMINDGILADWKILGGIIASNAQGTAIYKDGLPIKGYKFIHTYDERFSNRVPPFFPHAKSYEVVSWYE